MIAHAGEDQIKCRQTLLPIDNIVAIPPFFDGYQEPMKYSLSFST
jgi:hypothetical protein